MEFKIDIDKDDPEIFKQIKGNVIDPNCFGSNILSDETWEIVNFPYSDTE